LRHLLKKRRPTLGKKVGVFKRSLVTKGKIISDKIAAKRKLRFSNGSDKFDLAKKRRSSLSAACDEVKKIARGNESFVLLFKLIWLAVREAEPGVCKSLFWGTTELIIQIRKADSQPLFLGKNKSLSTPPSPKKLDSCLLSREPPLLRPSPPRITVKGKNAIDVGCVTAMYTDEQLTEQIYTLRGHCEVCKGASPTKKMAEHSQRKLIYFLYQK
jgi:hypothetical protein